MGSFQTTITKQVGANYLVVTPEDYHPEKKYPLLLFLHGRGEQGDDLELVKKHGPYKMVEQLGLPMIIVAPQSPMDEWWNVDMLEALVDHVVEELPVDQDRIYLTGLSMGGQGVWQLAIRRPELFAAMVPICGYSQPSKAKEIRHLPIWVFHGEKDDTVKLRESTDMVDALKAAGSEVRLTIYEDGGHDSWTATYNNPELYQWLLSHKRN